MTSPYSITSPYVVDSCGEPCYRDSENCRSKDRTFWGTSPEAIEPCREVLGIIDLDPASCFEANEAVIKASRFYSEADDGLQQPWVCETLFMNPPWNRQGRVSMLTVWVDKLLQEIDNGNVSQAILLTNSATDTPVFHRLMRNSDMFAFTLGRLRFMAPVSRPRSTNTRGQAFFYFGPRLKRFHRVFTALDYTVLRGGNFYGGLEDYHR